MIGFENKESSRGSSGSHMNSGKNTGPLGYDWCPVSWRFNSHAYEGHKYLVSRSAVNYRFLVFFIFLGQYKFACRRKVNMRERKRERQ